MPRRRTIDLLWPAGGEHRAFAYQRQPPYTCVRSQNVRTQTSLEERRSRGGQRPGLRKAFTSQLGGGNPVRLLAQVRQAESGKQTIADDFLYDEYPSTWTAASWLDGVPDLYPDTSPTYLYASSASTDLGIVYEDLTYFDDTSNYTVSIYVVPKNGYYGDYEIALRMDDSTPDVTTDGVRMIFTGSEAFGIHRISTTTRVTVSGADTDYSQTDFQTSGASGAVPVQIDVQVSGNVINTYFNGEQHSNRDISSHGSAVGKRIGIGLSGNSDTAEALIDWFSLSFSPNTDDTPSRVWTLASANGALYRDDGAGAFGQVTGDPTLSSATPIRGAEYLGKLYIADYSENYNVYVTDGVVTGTNTFDSASVADWTAVADSDDDMLDISDGSTVGTFDITAVASGSITVAGSPANDTGVTARVVRAPKVWDSVTNTISKWTATSGYIPLECPLICRFMGGIVLAGAKRFPHIAYHSASGDPTDWDTGSTSPTGSYATTLATTNVIAQPIRALIPYRDDYLVYGCVSQMWRQRGSLRQGGDIVCLSRNIGIVGADAWCILPDGTLVWMSHDGIYAVSVGGGVPEPISRDKLPAEFLNIDPSTVHVQMAWDHEAMGIKIALTTVGQNRTHWFLHWPFRAYWREKYATDHQPTALLENALINEVPTTLIGCADGYIREHSTAEATDDGTAITSYVDYGPIRLGRNDFEGGILARLGTTLAYNSEDVTWLTFVADTAEEVGPPYYSGALVERTTESGVTRTTESGVDRELEGVAARTGTWSAKRNYNDVIRRRGGAFLLEVGNADAATKPWAVENIIAEIEDGGRSKL